MAWLDTLIGDSPKERRVETLSWLVAGTALVALILFALAQSLRLPAHFGVEDWLRWRSAATLEAAASFWDKGLSRLPAAAAYLLIDTAVFMPLYGLTLLWATRQVRGTMGAEPALRWLIDGLQALAVLSLLLLWGADAVENLGGLARLGIAWGWGVAALALAVPGYLLLRRWAAAPDQRAGLVALAWLALSLVLAAAASPGLAGAAPSQADLAWIAGSRLFNGWAHAAKGGLLLAALLFPLGLWLCWWFGLDLDPRPAAGPQARERTEVRSACRQAAMGVVGRSRYVLAVLALFAAFTLLLDQCRDVLLALAGPDGAGGWWWLVMGTSAAGLAMLAHASWLWARLVGRIKRNGYEVSTLAGVADWAGEWARTWARLLMLAPLGMTAVLIANVAGDAVIAASVQATPDGPLAALARLAAFTVAILAMAVALMRQRQRRALPRPADYYNSVRLVRPLLHDPAYVERAPGPADTPARAPLHRTGRAVAWLAKPVWQPLVALALLLVVRGCMLTVPDITGTAPSALAVLTLSLVWWLGPLGLIAMSEQRAVFPWGLLLLLVAGGVGLFSDNHTLPALVIDNPELVADTLAALRQVALAGLVLLALASAAVWLALTQRSRDLLAWLGATAGLRAPHDAADRWRWGLGLTAAAVLCAGLFGLDRWAAGVAPAPASVAAAPATPAAQATTPAQEPLLLVASEGGGVRAAYWTARVLAGLQDADKHWMPRVAAMSGVSGGSMGIAVWRACARSEPIGPAPMTDCVKRGFGHLDALSPLLAGLLFEDVWMRVLPTDVLCQPASGCGLRSRALAFEREWMRAFPHLAERLGTAGPGEPDLLLNSTVVESGNRALLGTLQFEPGELPGAEDLLASGRVGSSPALVTAAHTSARFPLVNPLASLPRAEPASAPASAAASASPAASAPPALAAAHLVDGGYHDNSGTASLSDMLTLLRKRDQSAGRAVQLVLIRNGQVPSTCMPQALQETHREPPPACLDIRSSARELLPPRDAQRLKLYADLLGPAVTVLNNLGTGAHGREPVAALTARVLPPNTQPPVGPGCGDGDAVCLLDQVQDASLVPLGWTLSPAARAALDARADALVRQLRPTTK